jgi:hypothetical protein
MNTTFLKKLSNENLPECMQPAIHKVAVCTYDTPLLFRLCFKTVNQTFSFVPIKFLFLVIND